MQDLLSLYNLSRSGYYKAKKKKEDKYRIVKERILFHYNKSKKTKGYRWLNDDLRQEGMIINHKTVLRLMRDLKIRSVVRKKRYNYSNNCFIEDVKTKNILERNFKTSGLNEKWATDVTQFNVGGKPVFLSAVIDLYNKEIVGFSIEKRQTMQLVLDMLKEAFSKRPKVDDLILHSDQGSLYKLDQYKGYLKEMNVIQSMSMKGNCLDNAVIENFFGTLKCEWFRVNKFKNYELFKRDLEKYIDYFNTKRRSRVLGYCTPIEYRGKKE